MYENAYDSRYEELKTYYPVWYHDVLEMDSLWHVMGGQLDDIQNGIVRFVHNGFIQSADEQTIAKWERFLGITYEGPRTLDERRSVVLTFFRGTGHIGEQEIKEIISAFTSGNILISLSTGGVIEISITRELSDQFNLKDCLYVLNRRIPAHLKILFNDKLKPIPFEYQYCFSLNTLRLRFQFFNGGSEAPIFLNGSRHLNGSWILDQTFRGILFSVFTIMATFATADGLDFQVLFFSAMPIVNHVRALFDNLRVAIVVATEQFLENAETRLTFGVTNSNALSGDLTMNSMYELDGSVLLNGMRKLNADIIKEVI